MSVVDTTVIVAASASWHESHESAREALLRAPRLIAHCAIETFSVLTRLPAGRHLSGTDVRDFLAEHFEGDPLVLSSHAHGTFVARLVETGIAGGAAYDALIAATASEAGEELISLDRRALPVYARMGADARLLAA